MAIFSRRTIQRLLNENRGLLTAKQQRNFVRNLDIGSAENRLGWEWETALLNAFSKIGDVEYEKVFTVKEAPKPDIYFKDRQDPTKTFLADIKTFSDVGYDEAYPIEKFQDDIYQRAEELGIQTGAFSFRVGHLPIDISDPKPKIPFPNTKELPQVMAEAKIDAYLQNISLNVNTKHGHIIFGESIKLIYKSTALTIRTIATSIDSCVSIEVLRSKQKTSWYRSKFYWRAKFTLFAARIFKQVLRYIEPLFIRLCDVKINRSIINFSIHYDPNEKCSSSVYPSYSYVQRLTGHTFADRLNEKKKQLVGSGFTGLKGIILCDGDCEMLRSASSGWNQKSASQIIRHFLKQNPDVAFVFTFTVKQTGIWNKPYEISTQTYFRHTSEDTAKWLKDIASQLRDSLPTPVSDSPNAISHLKSKYQNEGESLFGRFNVSNKTGHTEIKISARALLDLLAGECGQENFLERHFERPIPVNPFQGCKKRGLSIADMAIERIEEKDDDWVVFKFKEADPAISPFS